MKIGGILECVFRHHFCCSVYSTTLFQTLFLSKFRSHFVGGPSVSTASKMPLGWDGDLHTLMNRDGWFCMDTSVGIAWRFPTEYVVTSPLCGIAHVTHPLQMLPHVAASLLSFAVAQFRQPLVSVKESFKASPWHVARHLFRTGWAMATFGGLFQKITG